MSSAGLLSAPLLPEGSGESRANRLRRDVRLGRHLPKGAREHPQRRASERRPSVRGVRTSARRSTLISTSCRHEGFGSLAFRIRCARENRIDEFIDEFGGERSRSLGGPDEARRLTSINAAVRQPV